MHVVCADINFSLSNSLKDRKKLDPVESKLPCQIETGHSSARELLYDQFGVR